MRQHRTRYYQVISAHNQVTPTTFPSLIILLSNWIFRHGAAHPLRVAKLANIVISRFADIATVISFGPRPTAVVAAHSFMVPNSCIRIQDLVHACYRNLQLFDVRQKLRQLARRGSALGIRHTTLRDDGAVRVGDVDAVCGKPHGVRVVFRAGVVEALRAA